MPAIEPALPPAAILRQGSPPTRRSAGHGCAASCHWVAASCHLAGVRSSLRCATSGPVHRRTGGHRPPGCSICRQTAQRADTAPEHAADIPDTGTKAASRRSGIVCDQGGLSGWRRAADRPLPRWRIAGEENQRRTPARQQSRSARRHDSRSRARARICQPATLRGSVNHRGHFWRRS